MTREICAQQDFSPEPSSVRAVRRFISEVLAGAPDTDHVVLAASELATNVVKYARTQFTVWLHSDAERVRLEVSDGTSIIPAVVELSESKWGLRIVQALSDQWGVDSTESGKTVWVTFPTHPDQTSDENRTPPACGE